jgi:DNA polymerase (family 10)
MLYEGGSLERGREGADLDVEAVLQAAAESGTIVEINASPERLDLNDVNARRANDLGCLFSIDTDAHNPNSLAQIHYGVAVSRRAWVSSERVVNTWPLEKLLAYVRE